jgi:WD40 repeat protein
MNENKTPFSYIAWRPENENFKTRNILTTVNAEGEIQNWHMNSGKLLSTMKDDSQVLDKQLYGLDFNPDGTKLVVCGS